MADKISTNDLVNKCKRFITSDVRDKALETLIKEAIIQADRDIHNCDSLSPLAWDIVPYDELRTNISAEISAITQADPGVITAASYDSDISGHGFNDHATIRDVVLIDGIDGMEELNARLFLVEYIDSTTFSLKSFDGLTAIDTSGYDAYSSGGAIYHCGFVLNTTTILADVNAKWTFKKILSATFDKYPATPISEAEIVNDKSWVDIAYARRPRRFRHWTNMTTYSTTSHYLLWYPPANQAYNVGITYQKEVPDLTWGASVYPFHPPEIHDALWHGALSNLLGNSKRVQRSSTKEITVELEVMFSQIWFAKWQDDLRKIRNLSREMLGAKGGKSSLSA